MQRFSADAKLPTKCAMCGTKHQLWLFNGKAYCYDHAYVIMYDTLTQCRMWSSVSHFIDCMVLNHTNYLGFSDDKEYCYFVVKTLLRITSLLAERGFAEPQSLLARDMLLLTSWFGAHLQHTLLLTVTEKHYSPIYDDVNDCYQAVGSTWVNQRIVWKLRGMFGKLSNVKFHGGIGSQQKLLSASLPQMHDEICNSRPVCYTDGLYKFAFPLNTITARLCREAELNKGQKVQGELKYAKSINDII